MKNNIQTTINTHHQCITCMKEYENKSLEELRMEDYAAGRKGPTPGAQPAGGLFGASSTPQTGFGFGQPQQQKPLFGAPSTSNNFTLSCIFISPFIFSFQQVLDKLRVCLANPSKLSPPLESNRLVLLSQLLPPNQPSASANLLSRLRAFSVSHRLTNLLEQLVERQSLGHRPPANLLPCLEHNRQQPVHSDLARHLNNRFL